MPPRSGHFRQPSTAAPLATPLAVCGGPTPTPAASPTAPLAAREGTTAGTRRNREGTAGVVASPSRTARGDQGWREGWRGRMQWVLRNPRGVSRGVPRCLVAQNTHFAGAHAHYKFAIISITKPLRPLLQMVKNDPLGLPNQPPAFVQSIGNHPVCCHFDDNFVAIVSFSRVSSSILMTLL